MQMSPISKGSPGWKYSTAGSQVGSSLTEGGWPEECPERGRKAGPEQDPMKPQSDRVFHSRSARVVFGGVGGIVFQRLGFRLSPSLGRLLADHFQPLGVTHLAARAEPAHPGAVRGLSKVHRDTQPAGRHGEAVHVVLVLVGDDDGVEGRGIFAGQLHAPEDLAATQARVDEDARAAAAKNRAVAPRPRRQHCEAHHKLRIQS